MKWTVREIEILKTNYPELGPTKCSKLINRSIKSIGEKARELNIASNGFNSRFKDISRQTFGRLYVESFSERKNNISYWNCICRCGKRKIIASSKLVSGATLSCGCYKKEQIIKRCRADITNKKFGKLTAVSPDITIGKVLFWNCRCECGNVTKVCSGHLKSGQTKSCGSCGLFRNGIATSFKALELHKMINRGVHNYKTKFGPVIDIAFVANGKKIAIEYNESYWHYNKIDKDDNRTIQLIENGWHVLEIRARKNLPDMSQLNEAINNLIYSNNTKQLITLEGWGK
jgi:very-short-patch-repair endonuclease